MKFKVQFQGQDPFFVSPGTGRSGTGLPQATLGPVRDSVTKPVMYLTAFGVEFQIFGNEIPSITVVEPEPDMIRYIITTEYYGLVEPELRTEVIRKPQAWARVFEVSGHVHHRASLIVAINERTGETRVLKSRWGQQGRVTP
jgi:hypothetical protein